MKTSVRKTRRLILAGAGHAHIEVLRRFAVEPDPLTEIVLLNPSAEALYSGMLPGFVARQYRWSDIVIDVAALASRAGAVHVTEALLGIDPVAKTVKLRRPSLSYDILSLDIGSTASLPPLEEGVASNLKFLATRPFTLFRDRLAHWDESAPRPGAEIIVAGSGAAGFELACCLRARYPETKISMLGGIFGTGSIQLEALRRLKITFNPMGAISRIGLGAAGFQVRTEKGDVSCSHLVCATGAKAHTLVTESPLAHAHGFLRVNEFLQSESVASVFGAGDCIHFSSRSGLAKSGVYAVRAAPILAANLRAALAGNPLAKFRPQKRFLRLMNEGDGNAIAEWGSFKREGAWAWKWKHRIDSRFMGMYKMEMPPMDEPDCGGCGSKAASEVVCELRAPNVRTAKTVWGTEAAEDVAVWESKPGARIAISVDQFKNFGVDPYNLGRITANAAASDLYAKGVKPEAALMTLTMPKVSSRLAKDWARQLNAGVNSVFGPEAVEVLGGHTTEGEEWSMGFTVWGSADNVLWAKRGLRAGDKLILTKPLGTGILLTAHMQGVQLGEQLTGCIDSMARSQVECFHSLQKFTVHACTDITGFSLLGHLSEMLEATGLGAQLEFSQIPFLAGARECFARGYRSRMHNLNMASFPVSGLPDSGEILYDPQTSGGLLVALSAADAEKLLKDLPGSALIGAIANGMGEQIRVLA